MLYSDALGRRVVSTGTAETIGSVSDLVIDPRSHAVVALTLTNSGRHDTLLWSDISAIGADAVTIAAAGVLQERSGVLSALTAASHDLIGKRVLNTLGEELGHVADLDFDPATGAVNTLVLPDSDVAGLRLVGVGPYAAVVHAN